MGGCVGDNGGWKITKQRHDAGGCDGGKGGCSC